ncbi:MAG TPA: hypothetical protein VKQ09_01685 [Sphingomonas sp.]|nr:hypothetical protein [Sphingomonas sp.]
MDGFDPAFDRIEDFYEMHDIQLGLAFSPGPIVPARMRAPGLLLGITNVAPARIALACDRLLGFVSANIRMP